MAINKQEMISPLDCFTNQPQEFLVCTTIYRAKDLPALNTDTYVKVTVGKQTKKTKAFHSSENPHYNEVFNTMNILSISNKFFVYKYFVFEMFCTVSELLRYTVIYEVKKKGSYLKQLKLGDLHIDLTRVWNNPAHGFYKKWGKLINSNSDVSSYLLIDLSVVVKNDKVVEVVEPTFDSKLENNLLLPNKEISNAKYCLTVYRGAFCKKSDYILDISIAGCSVSPISKRID